MLKVVIAPSLAVPLVSTSWLTNNLKCVVTHLDNRAFILDRKALLNNNPEKYLIATATVLDDGLYHIDNMHKFLNNCDHCNVASNTHINNSTSAEVLHGSARIKYAATTGALNPLEVLHVKLGHAPEALIKWIVKNGVVKGLGYTYDQIKNCTLKLCHACMLGRMRAFPIPASISRKEYGIFEMLSLDIIIFKKASIRHFTCTALYVDKCTSRLFAYHMKSKSELLDTLQRIIK